MLSDDAFSVVVPMLKGVLVGEIRRLFEANGLTLQAWEKARTDRVVVGDSGVAVRAAVA